MGIGAALGKQFGYVLKEPENDQILYSFKAPQAVLMLPEVQNHLPCGLSHKPFGRTSTEFAVVQEWALCACLTATTKKQYSDSQKF